MAQSELVLKATLGALVHDLGKIGVQASDSDASFSRFDCETPAGHSSFGSCKSCRSRFRYAHAPIGAHLLREAGAPDWMQQAALAHHSSFDAVGDVLRAVQLGDRLAAGERDDLPPGEGRGSPELRNIFSGEALISPSPLSVDAWIRGDGTTDIKERYRQVRDALLRALTQAFDYSGDNLSYMADHVSGAVQRGATLVPSAFYRTVADISLASHLQLAAAFAGAIAASGSVEMPARDKTIATLILGDLSGIQPFLHRVASRRAARALRARSFYIQLVAEIVARFVAEETGVEATNVISSAGGGFMVIAPVDAATELRSIQQRVERALFDSHGPMLSVALTLVQLTEQDSEDFSRCIAGGLPQVRERTWRRFESTAQAIGLFGPRGSGGPSRACRSCGGDTTDGVEDDAGRICSFCQSLEVLGRELTQRSFLLISRWQGDGDPPRGWQRLPAALGYDVQLSAGPPRAPFAGAILALDQAALDEAPCARLFPVGRHVPTKSDGAVDFEQIATMASGRPLIAVIKADVDDLGERLQQHFRRGSERLDSPSRMATFSRMLSLFFEGHVNQLAASGEFAGIYIVFAGGDDLLAAGPWDKALAFLRRVRDDFARWTGNNPDFHLSAGLAFGAASRPITQGLDEAEQTLRLAKASPGKNAVSLLGHTLKWDAFDQVLALRDALVGIVSGTDGSPARGARSLLQRLEQLEQHGTSAGRAQYGPHIWRMHYYLRRFAGRHGSSTTELKCIESEVLRPGGTIRLALAARLAEFQTSTRREE